MQVYDIIMLAVLIGATLFGAWKGLAWQVASLASILVSYYVALQFRQGLAQWIDATPPWNLFAAMLILFVSTSLLIWIAFGVVARFLDRLKLKEFDRQIGALLGLAKGIVLCVIITLFSVTLLGNAPREQIVHSYSGYCIALLLHKSQPVMPDEVRQVLDPYLNHLPETEPEIPYQYEGMRYDGVQYEG
jgi:membrane protein required for colicin V production